MGHEFPIEVNWNSTPAEIMTVHGVMLLMALAAVVCCCVSRRLPAKESTIWIWALVTICAPFVLRKISPELDRDASWTGWRFMVGYVITFWVSSLVGMRIVHRRLRLVDAHSPFGCLGPLLVATGLFLGFSILFFETSVTPRAAVQRSACRSNLRYIGIALHIFHDVYGYLPEPAKGTPPVSWRVRALPFLDNVELFETYDESLPWDSEENTTIAQQKIGAFSCPSVGSTKDNRDRWLTSYAMVTGTKTSGDSEIPRTFDDFTDGTSNTLAVVEAAGLNIVWTEPRDSQVTDENLGINLPGPTPHHSPAFISAWHRGGGHVLYGDGAVRFLSHDIDPAVLKAITTVNGGEMIPEHY